MLREFLRPADVETLGEGVYATLERVGILCENEEILLALREWGARVDLQQERAWFPVDRQRRFVEDLRRETGAPAWGTRRGGFSVPGQPTLGCQVAQHVLDDDSGVRRLGSRADFVRLVQVGEALHGDSGVGHCLLLADVPPLVEPLEAALLLAGHCRRPQPVFAWNVRQVPYLQEMGEIMGMREGYTLGAVCFGHPFRFDRDTAARFVLRARSGTSTGLTAMPVAGASTPATLGGFLVVTTAEHLATWMAARALNPGVALGGSMWAGAVDMKTATVSYSCFDAMLYAVASVEFVEKFCGVRVSVGGGEYCDAKEPGLFAALEKAYKAMTIAAFTGQHPGLGQGMLDVGKVLSAAQLLIERDLTTGAAQFGRGVDTSPAAVGLETIAEVGIGLERNYLTCEHTAHHFRQGLWLPRFIDRSGWTGAHQDAELLTRTRGAVRDLIASYRKPEVDEDRLRRLRQVVERARRELLG